MYGQSEYVVKSADYLMRCARVRDASGVSTEIGPEAVPKLNITARLINITHSFLEPKMHMNLVFLLRKFFSFRGVV